MIEATVKRGILVTVLVLITCILGIVASTKIPVQMIPDLEVRTITVQTGWPGATPQDVEKEILIEQERYLRSLPNLKRMISSAGMGSARIELEFPFGVDVNEALIRVSNALSQVPAYPENVDQPRLFSSSFSSNAFMHFRLIPLPGNPMQLDIDMLRDFPGGRPGWGGQTDSDQNRHRTAGPTRGVTESGAGCHQGQKFRRFCR
jgi:multidrug efflux pump subunit AcrB